MKDNTERQIKKAFLELNLLHQSERISVKQIVEKANISRATFYTYYENVESLVDEIEDTVISDVEEMLGMWEYIPIDSFNCSKPFPNILKLSYYVNKNMITFKAIFGEYGRPSFYRRYQEMIRKAHYKKWTEEGYNNEQSIILASLAAGGITSICEDWIKNDYKTSPEKMALILSKMICALSSIGNIL